MVKRAATGLGVIAVIASLAIGVRFGVQMTVDHAVKIDAEREAGNWARYFIDHMPGVVGLLKTTKPTDEQLGSIEAAEQLGNVFRFKLFDRTGNMVLVSDEARYRTEGFEYKHSEKALAVISSGVSNISLGDGTNKKNRPPLYVEAYVPLIDGKGEIVGVVEVYVDQTTTSVALHQAFTSLAVGLVIAFSLAFGLPALAYMAKTLQEKRARAKVDYLASYDPMTDLLNRASFSEALAARCMEDDPDWQNAAFIYVDVDNFKDINDNFGHNAGDAYLKHLARCLSLSRRDHDLVARIGGDEFVMVAFGQTAESVVDLVESLRASASEPIDVSGRTIIGKVSVGVYWERGCTSSAEIRMQRADMALYQAKKDGRNVCCLFSKELEERIEAHRAIENAILSGLEEDRFDLRFQPVIDTQSRRCAGFETLLRLRDEHDRNIMPSKFIRVAEAMGAINEIGLWVLNKAVQTAAALPDDLFISVNLSAKQFEDGKLVHHVSDALERYGVPPGRLELEITETILMVNSESIGAQIKELRDLGVSVAMDDFGTGYSGLGYLWKFKFDKLKIDRSFISALDFDSDRASEILDTVVVLGHKLDMSVTAEGIESEAQAEALSKLSCDHFQGYLFSKPLIIEEVAPFLLKNLRDEGNVPEKAGLSEKSA